MHLGQCSSLVENSLWQSEPGGREKIDVTKLMKKFEDSHRNFQARQTGKMEFGGMKRQKESPRISEN